MPGVRPLVANTIGGRGVRGAFNRARGFILIALHGSMFSISQLLQPQPSSSSSPPTSKEWTEADSGYSEEKNTSYARQTSTPQAREDSSSPSSTPPTTSCAEIPLLNNMGMNPQWLSTVNYMALAQQHLSQLASILPSQVPLLNPVGEFYFDKFTINTSF